jgi:hypothetical protein
VYRFTIAGDGTVSKVDATSSILGGGLDTCVKRVLGSLVFPAPRTGDVLVSLPLVFDSTGAVAVEQPAATVAGPWTPFALGHCQVGGGRRGARDGGRHAPAPRRDQRVLHRSEPDRLAAGDARDQRER